MRTVKARLCIVTAAVLIIAMIAILLSYYTP